MILVTGANGQLAKELNLANPESTVFADRTKLDITNLKNCRRFIGEHGISTIINAAAYTAVDKAESEPEAAFLINQTGPENLAKALSEHGTGQRLMVHISTDYVFNGQSHTPYTETDAPAPTSTYGRSKLAGEQAVLTHATNAIILRTSWLYSAIGPTNFMRTMLRLGHERENLNVVFDQIGTPTNCRELAHHILTIIPQCQSGIQEVFHYSDEGVTSWYDFAMHIMQTASLSCNITPIRSSQYPTPATRPAYSVMDKAKIKSTFNLTLNHWQANATNAIKEMQSQ